MLACANLYFAVKSTYLNANAKKLNGTSTYQEGYYGKDYLILVIRVIMVIRGISRVISTGLVLASPIWYAQNGGSLASVFRS